LQGRGGRQGDPGSNQFFLSLEDDLLRIFGGERVKNLMNLLKIPEDQPIESSLISKVITEAQKKVEGFNFDLRKHLLEYDDVLNKQRNTIYKKRQEILEKIFVNKVTDIVEELLSASNLSQQLNAPEKTESDENNAEVIKKIKSLNDEQKKIIGQRILSVLDMLWMNHLENLEALHESVRIRAYGQKDPLVEYKYESRGLFRELLDNFKNSVKQNIEQLIR